MLISVVVAVYNIEQYIDRCVQSIISSEYADLEILLVNDGSIDDSLAKCLMWADKDSRVKVLSQENKGLSGARNTGLSNATGEYICFIDGDDYIRKEMFSTMIGRIIVENADICVCGYSLYRGNILRRLEIRPQESVFNREEALRRLLLDKGFSVYAWNKLYRRTLFDTISYPEGKTYEDVFTTYKVVNNADRVVTISEPFYCYVIRNDSITHTINKKFELDRLDAYKMMTHDLKIVLPSMKDLLELKVTAIHVKTWNRLVAFGNRLRDSDCEMVREYIRCNKTTIKKANIEIRVNTWMILYVPILCKGLSTIYYQVRRVLERGQLRSEM